MALWRSGVILNLNVYFLCKTQYFRFHLLQPFWIGIVTTNRRSGVKMFLSVITAPIVLARIINFLNRRCNINRKVILQIRSATPIQDINTSAPIHWHCDGLALLAKIRSIVVRWLAVRKAQVRIPVRHPREALYWAKSNEETRVDPRRMDVWMNVLYGKNIENKQKEWLMQIRSASPICRDNTYL